MLPARRLPINREDVDGNQVQRRAASANAKNDTAIAIGDLTELNPQPGIEPVHIAPEQRERLADAKA
ncbi:MAG: hypothetical protein ACLP00_12575 [Terracidiphilus sp.]